MDTAIKSKLQTLLRMGLVSPTNVRRAVTMFQDPERYAKSPAYRTLMQEILVDIMDKIVNNRVIYTALRSTLGREASEKKTQNVAQHQMVAGLGEAVETDRTNVLLRSGIVDKSQITAARKALKSKSNMKSMSMGKVYREMMINMLDSMVKKITGNPTLFNAFKYTMGKDAVEESFDGTEIDAELIALVGLHEDAEEILEANKPTKPELWSKAKSLARSKFKVYPSAYANGWAVKWYNSKGGGWKSVSEGKSFHKLSQELNELSKSTIASYVQKAHQQQRMNEFESGMEAAKGKHYQHPKFVKREIGISRALRKLQKEETDSIKEGSAVPSRKEAVAAIKWGKKALKNPAKHNISKDDILANMKVARDSMSPIGAKSKKESK